MHNHFHFSASQVVTQPPQEWQVLMKEFLNSNIRGQLKEGLHIFKKTEGIPSGPELAGFNSQNILNLLD